MAKLKIWKAGKVGHGNTKRITDAEQLHGRAHRALPMGSGATTRISQRSATGSEEERGLRLPGSLRRGSGG
ncbi:MAG: hypothetical protein QOE42_666 [Chloroflexota bacterium]|jgi:hypothetical protein|nr:hypothetical protein [Chloroflexota bacterium]